MKGRRWRREEDELLKRVVLETIQNGGTQLKAFAEVGKKLGRTPGACGFRWNAVLRKNDPNSYQEAKRKRVFQQLEKRKLLQIDSFAQVIRLLEKAEQEWKMLKNKVHQLNQMISEKKATYQELKKENQQLKEQQHSLDSYQEEVKERYKELLQLAQTLKLGLNHDKRTQKLGASLDTKIDSVT